MHNTTGKPVGVIRLQCQPGPYSTKGNPDPNHIAGYFAQRLYSHVKD